jgi:hypothetical protein
VVVRLHGFIVVCGAVLIVCTTGAHQARSSSTLDPADGWEQAKTDRARRDAILKSLSDPQRIPRIRVDPVGATAEVEELIRQLRPFRHDPVVIRRLLSLYEFRANEWVGDPPRLKCVWGGFDEWLARPQPAREILVEMGPAAVPVLLDIYLERYHDLAAGADTATARALREDSYAQPIYSILSERRGTGRAAINQMKRRVADRPKDKLVRAACHDFVNKLRYGVVSSTEEGDEVRAWLDANKP